MGVTAQTPSVQAMARMSGQLGAGSTFNIATRGSILNDASVQESRSFQAGASPAGQSDRWYEVTPYTKVIFSGFLDMDVRRNLPNTDKFLQIARTRMVVEHSLSPNNEVAYLEYGLELVYEPDTHKSWSGRETFVYENASGRPGSGYISIQVGSEGEIFRRLNVGSSAPAAPVPEPASAALMLCGLGVVAGVARRARRR
ncbi:PEP-CTERM sorting domain-containing protein [Azohydromonas sp. G-1-1-14]|uniref:PEP-CTERM sorting domain-containing protein n=2 Tax=Azohydromonas caseinilytica TaxID=2728836 RepID=A0A848FC73_9BURK|nr:PEP-CTERM sorting domain-containing protein [Azohydromonas caseinilytica]